MTDRPTPMVDLWRIRIATAKAMLENMIEPAHLAGSRDALVKFFDEVEQLAAEDEDTDTLRNRMAELLTGVATGLKGPPGPLKGHDWSDLPALAEAMRAENKDLYRVLATEHLSATQGWQRYESANADRNALRAELAELASVWHDPARLHANLLKSGYPRDSALHLAGATDYDAMVEVLANLGVQLWGPPHPDADNPRHWTDLPAKLAQELADTEADLELGSKLLRDIAAALKGPPPNTMWGFASLPQLANELRTVLNELALVHSPDAPDDVLWTNLPALARANRRGQMLMKDHIKAIREHASGLACWWGMTEAQEDLAGSPILDEHAILHFMGSGASTMVTAREIRRMLDTIYGAQGMAAETSEQGA